MSSRSGKLGEWPSIALAMLSLSIGWGIRGNFGHEFGAMMPGMLCAVAVALCSARRDWRERVLYFGFFGSIGWGFGGSVAYMPTMSYAQSGHLPTQLYGWFSVFVVGFLWASMGGAGTAYAAVETRERLTAVFRPFCWVLAAWTIEYLIGERLEGLFASGFDSTDLRQDNPFYWLDSEWMEANWALLGLGLYELWDRRFKDIHWMAAFGAAGAAIGWALQAGLRVTGLLGPMLAFLVRPLGDPTAISRATGQPIGDAPFMTNWPQIFTQLGDHFGWTMGLILGVAVFFWRYGRWANGASLILHIVIGSYVVFLLLPVLGACWAGGVGGIRLQPPRGDSWANILGCFAGMLAYMFRNRLQPVAYVSIMSGFFGGLGFVAAEFVKILAVAPGNPVISQDATWLARWAHWHSSNWHSLIAEQGVGLLYGLAIVLPMAMLARRLPIAPEEPRVHRWTEGFSVFFAFGVLLYVNMVKNVEDWTRVRDGHSALPAFMKAPLIPQIELSALGWFNLTYVLMAACLAGMLWMHYRRRLEFVPASWTGKGQLFYLLFLWAILVMNWERAVVAFNEQRLDTEWILFVNGVIASWLIACFVRAQDRADDPQPASLRPLARKTLLAGACALLAATVIFTAVHRSLYNGQRDGFGGRNLRFGPDADWRTAPTLLHHRHP